MTFLSSLLLLTAAPAAIISSGDQMVDARLATLGRLTEGDSTALLRMQPSVLNVKAPAGKSGSRIRCPSISGSYSYSTGGKRTSGRYSVSSQCTVYP